MTSQELTIHISEFLNTCRASTAQHQRTVENELYPNEAIQDILHAIEFSPSTIDAEQAIQKLHEMRAERRTAKRELEVTQIFKAWVDECKSSLNKLEAALGNMRKALNRQEAPFYTYKTDVLCDKGSILRTEEQDELHN